MRRIYAGSSPYRYLLVLALAHCGGPVELPPWIASSKYIEYHTDLDASAICMDDYLAHEDRFIERTAALLGLDPPSGTIDFVWDPVQDGSEPWACAGDGAACYVYQTRDGSDHIASRTLANHHELVHWITTRALGRSHPILGEGLAEYLGSLNQTPPSDAFPAAFKKILASGPETQTDYRLAMRFVGAIFERHGPAKYRALRKNMPRTASPQQFAEIFAAQIGQSLDDALAEMSAEHIYALDQINGCGQGDQGGAPQLEWTREGLLETTIDSACGDPWFYGAGFVPGRPAFIGRYLVDIPTPGFYKLTLTSAPGGPAPLTGGMVGCTHDLNGMGLLAFVRPEPRLLAPGTYVLGIGFPARPDARGQATVRLEYLGPPTD